MLNWGERGGVVKGVEGYYGVGGGGKGGLLIPCDGKGG